MRGVSPLSSEEPHVRIRHFFLVLAWLISPAVEYPEVTGNRFTGNSARSRGGALFVYTCAPVIANIP